MKKNIYEKQYNIWRQRIFLSKIGFFPIFSSFEEKIINLSPGALKLYLYLGIHSNYQTGKSYYSISKLAEILHKSPRTISSWFKELEDNDVIVRKQEKLNGVSTTYLRPYYERKDK